MLLSYSMALCKESLMFPEDFTAFLAGQAFGKAGPDLSECFPLLFISPAAHWEKLSFFSWVCRTCFPGCQATKPKFFPMEGAGRGGCMESQSLLTFSGSRGGKAGKNKNRAPGSVLCGYTWQDLVGMVEELGFSSQGKQHLLGTHWLD